MLHCSVVAQPNFAMSRVAIMSAFVTHNEVTIVSEFVVTIVTDLEACPTECKPPMPVCSLLIERYNVLGASRAAPKPGIGVRPATDLQHLSAHPWLDTAYLPCLRLY